MSSLEALVVENTSITDAGLMHLKGLKRLRELRIVNTAVTDAGVKALQAALPNLKVEYWTEP